MRCSDGETASYLLPFVQPYILTYQAGSVLGNARSESIICHSISFIEYNKAVGAKHHHMVLYRRLGETKPFRQFGKVHLSVGK